jgi:hypothetical protein
MRLERKSNKEKKMISQKAPSLEEVSSTTTHLKMDEAWKQIKQREENDFSKSTKLRRSLINNNMPQDVMLRIFTQQLAPFAYKMFITST